MLYDIFFSICQTPVDGHQPDEAGMFRNFFHQVEAADRLGYEIAWVAESHLSSQVQKRTSEPVVPHWEGEIGLNVDLLQLAAQVFRRTKRIEVGSAIMNILCNGGPVAAAERIAFFLALRRARSTPAESHGWLPRSAGPRRTTRSRRRHSTAAAAISCARSGSSRGSSSGPPRPRTRCCPCSRPTRGCACS